MCESVYGQGSPASTIREQRKEKHGLTHKQSGKKAEVISQLKIGGKNYTKTKTIYMVF